MKNDKTPTSVIVAALILCSVLVAAISGIGRAQETSLQAIVNDFARQNPGVGVVAKNLSDGTEASVNASKKFTSASLYKLFVAQHLYERKKAGSLNFNQSFRLQDVEAQHSENEDDCNNVQACIKAIWPTIPIGQSATVAACLPKMISYSDNICGKTFLDYARDNGIVKYPGYNQTTLSPLSTSAADVAKLMTDIANNTWVDGPSSAQMYSYLKQQYHKEKIPAGLPAGTDYGNKTGEIHNASSGKSHDAAIVKAGGKTYVLVILTNKNPDLPATKTAFANFSKRVYEFITNGTDTGTDQGSGCAPEAVSVQDVRDERNEFQKLNSPFYDLSVVSCCEDTGLGGSADGGPLSGVRFPDVPDTAVFAQAIKEYIQKGWPTSPLIPFAEDFVKFGLKYDVNPAIPVVIAQVEYQFGTARTDLVGRGGPGQYNFWAVTHNSNSATRFGPYPSIIEAMEAHYRLLAGKNPPFTYIGPPQNFTTVSQIMNQYAPSFENDTPRYIQTILDGMKKLLGDAGAGGAPSETSGAVDASVSENCPTSNEDGTSVSADGYAFPIHARKKSDIQTFGALNSLPCGNPSGCHHTGGPGGQSWGPKAAAAFDLGVSGYGPDGAEGAPVYAISDGVLVHVNHASRGSCNSVTLKSSKDGFVYWYGHLRQDRSVTTGKQVKAGDKIGNVGKRTPCADGTTPHLHIDRVPEGGSPGSGPDRDPGIIPIINKLYEAMPE